MLAYNPIIQPLNNLPFNYKVDVLRLDILHKSISGNKWFKLKYNLQKAQQQNNNTIITFGGAYSNHIAATANACKLFNFKSVGIIRGKETTLNSTLIEAKKNGMQFEFVSREQYSHKNEQAFKDYLQTKYGNHFLIPEGGKNVEGVLGCTEIIKPKWDYDYILCACGTATTFSGIVLSIKNNAVVIGISVLKGENKLPINARLMFKNFKRHCDEGSNLTHLKDCFFAEKTHHNDVKINSNEELDKEIISQHCITSNYSFNGYANYHQPLINFKINFEKTHNIPLDYIYTNQLFFATFDLMLKQKFKKNAKILVIHSGGLQGNNGFEQRFNKI